MVVVEGSTPFIDWSGLTTTTIDGEPVSAVMSNT